MRPRRLRKTAAHLEITAFINLIVVLVPFLLSTAVFTRLAVMDLQLPGPDAQARDKSLDVPVLQLEVVLRHDALEVGDRVGGLIQRIPREPTGAEMKTLGLVMQQVKARFPDETRATLLAEADTPYEQLVQVMDVVRAGVQAQGARVVRTELFPQIAVGDAPLRRPAAQAVAQRVAQASR